MAARVRFQPRESALSSDAAGGPSNEAARPAPLAGSASIVQADLVDVSAGGLRARCPLPRSLEPGREVDVEIIVQGAGPGGPAPLVNLRGHGKVIWIEDRKRGYYTALKFIGALTLREPFAQMLLF